MTTETQVLRFDPQARVFKPEARVTTVGEAEHRAANDCHIVSLSNLTFTECMAAIEASGSRNVKVYRAPKSGALYIYSRAA